MHPRIRSTALAASILTISALTLPALAGTPKAIDRIPTSAPVVFGIPNIGSLLSDLDQVNAMLGEGASPEAMMVGMMIRGMEGLDLDGSLAVAIYPDADGGNDIEAMQFYAVVPVSDFGAISQGREAKNGIVDYPLPNEQMGYLRDIGGGFALFGDDADELRVVDASNGRMDANNTLLGSSGQGIASGSDFFVYVNLGEMDDAMGMVTNAMEDQSEMVEMMGGEQAAMGVDMMTGMIESFADDGQSLIFGMNIDVTDGITFDAGMQFKSDSTAASYLMNKGSNASKYLNNIPGGDFFFASTMDFSGEGIESLFNDYMAMAKEMDETGMLENMNLDSLIKDAKGGASVMGASNPMAMTGLLSTIVSYYESDNADSTVDTIAGMYSSMDNIAEGPLTVTSTFDKVGKEINGSTAHAYGVQFDLDMPQGGGGFGSMMSPEMIFQGVFGPNLGPAGNIGKAGNGVVQTMDMDEFTYARAVDAANGKDTLAQNSQIMRASQHLQGNTVFEFYLGADHLLNNVGPSLMMFGVLPEFEQLPAHAPIAMGFTADGGGVSARCWIPMEVIGTVMELMPSGAFDDYEDEEYGDDDDSMDF